MTLDGYMVGPDEDMGWVGADIAELGGREVAGMRRAISITR